ncbi:transcription elongation factor SPT6-like [Capsella rubella]|uniref:transcription elongation factor SPT6-like n=1 Tax=Capsella rubella TaxID=81985 RepID=UPI000CD5215D|nr:transcription elongation factor SPT6-like [Capsella rubella]
MSDPLEIRNNLKKRKLKHGPDEIFADIHERVVHSSKDHQSDGISIEEESNWIHAQLRPLLKESDHDRINIDDIANFLVLHHVEKLEIPFIAMYRKEQCRSLLEIDFDLDHKPEAVWHKVLWMIQDLDRQWLLLRERKVFLLGFYYSRLFQQESANQFLLDSLVRSVKAAETEREVDDVDSKFCLHFPPPRDYTSCAQHNNTNSNSVLREAANKFGYSSEQVGLAWPLKKLLVGETEVAKETSPEEMALNYVSAMFEHPQAVLTGARHVAATELSCEPSIKKCVRRIYMQNALVSVSPTPLGNMAIDSFHQLAGVKWLRGKPLTMFEGTQWLLIHKAEEDNLLQVSFKLPENCMYTLVSECSKHFPSAGVSSKCAQLWDKQRKLILEEALDGFLLPSMEKEARLLLTSKAKVQLLSEYGHNLWNKVSEAPYTKHNPEFSTNEEAAPRVLACCWGPGNPATTFVMLDSFGELLDVLYADSISLPPKNADSRQCIKKDKDRLLKFMEDHKPGVVALGAANLSCARLKDNIFEVMFEMAGDFTEVPNWIYDLSIVYVDESLPRIYQNSQISGEQLPHQSGIERRAVALGRYLQNPLAMVATLCGQGREILSWNLHSLENFLDPDEKYRMVEQVMVDITNQVGIDLNLASSHEWLFSPLQFISGLGLRKAASLQSSLIRAGSVFSRKDLINHGLAKQVFVNAVGFLRIRRSGLAASSSSQSFHLLDDTRIHPESYGLAQELAKDIYDLRGGDNYNVNATERVRDDGAASLRNLVLDEYLGSRKQESKKETYSSIIRELCGGFKDWRRQYSEPSTDEELSMITGETITEGRIMQATVKRVRTGKAVCLVDCGLTGTLLKEDYSDDGKDILDLSNRLFEGDVLTCKIKSTQKNLPRLFLVCKESEMRNNGNLDPYYHEEGVQIEKEMAPKEKDRFKFRMIVHPSFRNITAHQATEYLSDKQFGDCVVHPSSRGVNYLTLTLKIYDNVYVHKEIVEGMKEDDVCIGKTLRIGEETYECLDWMMDWYVGPWVARLVTILNHRKFRTGTQPEVDDLLRIEKGKNPKMVVYGFGVSHEHPGTFILSYIRSIHLHHEYIGLSPKGFKFRKKMFQELGMLVAYFKRHIHDRSLKHQ